LVGDVRGNLVQTPDRDVAVSARSDLPGSLQRSILLRRRVTDEMGRLAVLGRVVPAPENGDDVVQACRQRLSAGESDLHATAADLTRPVVADEHAEHVELLDL